MAATAGKLEQMIKSADMVIAQHAAVRVNGKVASLRTQDYSREVLRETCRRLHGLGFYLPDVNGITRKHLDAVVRSWHEQGMSPKTMQNQLSRLRIFAGWIKKAWVVSADGVPGHLPDVPASDLKVKTYTENSRSWTGNGVDMVKIIKAAKLEDQRLGMMLLLGVSFGLRKKEMLRIKLWKADAGHELRIDGSVAKNGRFRAIPIDVNEPYGKFQRWCLDEAKKVCKKLETLGWPGLSFKQAENRYYHYLKKLQITKVDMGICGHGLRAEFAENMALINGLVPPSLGGSINQMGVAERKEITNGVSNLLGHDKEHTIGAYFSTFRPVVQVEGLGGQVGPVIVIDLERDIFATIWVNPCPVRGIDGGYRMQTDIERSKTKVTVLVEKPWEPKLEVEIEQFVAKHPRLAEKIRKTLVTVGLGQ